MSYRMKLEFLDAVPERNTDRHRLGKYDVLLLQFVKSGKPAALVRPPEKVKTATIIGGFRKAIAYKKYPVVCIRRGGEIFLCLESEVRNEANH